LFRSADPLADLLQSPSTPLVKRTIQVCASIYPTVFEIWYVHGRKSKQ
jgi:hypothetical protein